MDELLLLLTRVLAGVIAGVTYSLTSFVKKKDQPFDWNKFLTTIVFGVFVGGMGYFLNLPLDVANTYALNIGLVAVSENIVKIVWRKILSPILS